MDEFGLIGKEICQGWTIERTRLPSGPGATGGNNSIGYIARNEQGEEAFVKVLNVSLRTDAYDPVADLKLRVDVFEYEKSLLQKCATMSRVVSARASGIAIGVADQAAQIGYLILEVARGDLRDQVEVGQRFEEAFRLRVLHHTAVGLQQLHSAQIAHQDIKPSNILVFDKDEAKLGDLGHAHDKANPRPEEDRAIAADPTYAPPEQLYGYSLEDWTARRFAADLYHLGSLIVFLYTGVGITSALAGHLRPEHHWDVWLGEFKDVLPYVRDSWNAVVEDLSEALDSNSKDHASIIEIVRQLSDPDPALRGHKGNIGQVSRYDLQRFISQLDLMARRAEAGLRRSVQAGR